MLHWSGSGQKETDKKVPRQWGLSKLFGKIGCVFEVERLLASVGLPACSNGIKGRMGQRTMVLGWLGPVRKREDGGKRYEGDDRDCCHGSQP